MAAWKIAPSLAVGCSAVIKPAEQTPLSTIRLAELMQQAGVPDGVINIVPGYGETAGKAIGMHNDIDTVSFTGSSEVGRMFMRYSGDSNLKGVGLEMGGKSPFIVLEDAILDDELIEHAAMSAFWNGGQNCSANMRQLIAAPLVEEFTGRIIDRVKAFKLGDPLDPSTDIGSMITKDHKEMVMSYIQSGIAEGAGMLMGGDSDFPGHFIKPTVFENVTPEMKIAKEEIFGPVLGIMSVKNADEALKIASDTLTKRYIWLVHFHVALFLLMASLKVISKRHLVVINNLVHLRVTMEQRPLSNIFKQKQFGYKLRILKYAH
jgi:aldehyde dehydrogenase (NAD+)/gamma-glutamyl-gamma-aminobutyraldehyde dehydrogenase